jgi:transcriptional regulator with XRE-family HTH domain
MSAAEMIVRARESAGISQAELARRIGVPRSVMNVYEHGRREPGADVLLHIVAATGNQLDLTPRKSTLDPNRAARILEQVIELAEALPYRPRPEVGFPDLRDRLA